MKWAWQLKNWPKFEFDLKELAFLEMEYQRNTGKVIGMLSSADADDHSQLKIEVLTQEALSTSLIEGEILKRDSVQSSIRRHLGLSVNRMTISPNEAGIAELMVDVYNNFDQNLTKTTLCSWHQMITNGRRDLEVIGDYRKHAEPMQIVSGNLSNQKIFFEAPPSTTMNFEMERLINWYNEEINNPLTYPNLTFAGIAHLHLEMIHPFEDGNGRIGRALVEKALSQRNGGPTLNSFARIIELKRSNYYQALQTANHDLVITKWLKYFAATVIESQEYTIRLIAFLINKAKFFAKFQHSLNERQEKVILRIFSEGIEGFKGGLSSKNYQSISGASPATATRDLQMLIEMGALQKQGALRHTRYSLALETLE